ncbi:MAG: leucyl/phenylalanyl-tRNA--protein transferase [Novosphingobium sp.]
MPAFVMHATTSPEPLDPELLLTAYRAGIFPMADSRDDPEVFWVEPRLRAILPLDGLRLSRSLQRTMRRERFTVTCNAAFDEVIDACAEEAEDRSETWISGRIAASYRLLHHLGDAHSIECWEDDGAGGRRLAGGLYGVGFDRAFCGESMFTRSSDASKVALVWLVAALRRAGVMLLDCQFMTLHLASLGAVEIDRAGYLELLRQAQAGPAGGVVLGGDAGGGGAAEGAGRGLPAGFAALLAAAADAGLASSPGKFIAQSLTHTS